MKRILVCGGRDYGSVIIQNGHILPKQEEIDKLNSVLDSIKEEFGDITIIQGEARGADTLAKKWAQKNSVPTLDFPADWGYYGKSAGYYRNIQMLEEGEPSLVVVFPGGRGTDMMCEIARKAGVEIRRIVV